MPTSGVDVVDGTRFSLVVHVLAPTGRDAELICGVLQQHGLSAEPAGNLRSVLASAHEAALGALLVAEEALSAGLIVELGGFLRAQPAWSDLPILILTGSGRETRRSSRLQDERLPLGAPILLERPIRAATLVSSVQAALRARERQYEIRIAFQERDRALEALRQERETLQVILDNLPVGVVFAKASGEIVQGSRSAERILGHPMLPTPNVESYKNWVGFHPDGRRVEGREYPLARAMAEGRAIPAEDFLYQRGDGTRAWLSLAAAPILDADGVVTAGVVAITDIDQQKRAEAELRTSEERFRRLVETATVGVLIGHGDGRISYMNPYLLRLLGYSEDEVSQGNLRWDELTPMEYAEADRRSMEELETVGTATPYPKEFRAKDGRLIPLLLGATRLPAPPESRLPHEDALFLTDLSSQKQAEMALIRSEKLAAVGRLAASISHEINNPLESVTNLLYLSLQDATVSEEVKQYLKTADHELRRVSQIVSQTLRFHRQSTRPKAISAEALLELTLGLYSGRIANAGITLRLEHRPCASATCYEGEIRQVLNNLIANAIEAMRLGGVLTIRSGPTRVVGKPAVRITIADTGSGITPEVRRRIFEPFYTTKGINGTGLGLWISLGIVEKHHGRLQVRSTMRAECSGAVFSLVLPVV